MERMFDHEKLHVYQDAIAFCAWWEEAAIGCRGLTTVKDQLDRASTSVPLNIAEGSTLRGSREYRRYLDTAWALLAEVQTALEIARDVGYIQPADFGRLEALAIETSKTLYGLLRKISDSSSPKR